MLDDFIAAYLGKLRRADAAVVGLLRPGTGDVSAFDRFDAVRLPPEVLRMWAVFDGTRTPADVTPGKTWIDGEFCLLGVKDACEAYGISCDLRQSQADFHTYLPAGFVPIGTPGEGSFLMLNARPGSPTYGAVYELFKGVGLTRASDTLTCHFETLNAAFDAGALWVGSEGYVDVDLERMSGIGRRINPGCDRYDDGLTEAQVLRDWDVRDCRPSRTGREGL